MSFSSKKSSRAKKGDANAGNFVFKFGADAPTSPSINFSSQPGSPAAASPGAFNFTASNPSSPATASFNFGASSPALTSNQPFVFGDASSASASSPTTNNAFSFSSANTSGGGFGSAAAGAPSIKRHQSEINSLAAPDRSSLRRSASEMTFGASSNPSTPPATNTGAFNFSTPAASPSTSTSGFSFNTANAAAGSPKPAPAISIAPLNTQTSANSFGSAFSTSSTTNAPTTSFGSFTSPSLSAKPITTTSSATPVASAFSFNTPKSTAAPAAPGSAFSFGSSPVTTPSTAANPPAAVPASSTPSLFGFSTPASATTAATNKPATATTTPAAPGFSFGSPSVTPAATTTPQTSTPAAPASTGLGGFSFNKPSDSPKVPAATTSATTTPSFSFGTPAKASDDKSVKPATSVAATTTPSLTFGSIKPSTSTATAPAAPPTFSFKPTADATSAAASTSTTTTSTAAAPSSVPKFTFGGDKDKKDEGKSAVTSNPFSFGTPSAAGATSTSAAAATTITPAITVDPSKPNPFSFEKVLEDLAKIAAQPPSQIYASLITPGIANTLYSQNTVVNHTNFRIDNIMPTTRFTELPEQAQKELDELEKYIRMEGQRSEYIVKQKMPQHLDAMDNARKNTEILSQQLDALSSTLKVQIAGVESLYDAVKGQLRHTNDGCAVLEACKHPGNNARWLFGYSEDDDYFSKLARQLGDRVEEYKRCIWEVERTAESWTQNKVQSPQDVADIMRDQNRAFIALSHKVASLHETVEALKNRYSQYLNIYS